MSVIQVKKSHYEFTSYLSKNRWASMWHQLDEVIKLKPAQVLEIGPGPGVFKAAARALGTHVETLDVDPALSPDHVASVFDMPFQSQQFDVVCAFQMLEHLPFEESRMAFKEMARVAKKAIVISLPDAATAWPISIHIPKIGALELLVPKPQLRPRPHVFDGQHHWEVNKAGFSVKHVSDAFSASGEVRLTRTFRVHENAYHRFFVYEKAGFQQQ